MNYFISDLIDEKIVGRFNEKELQKKKDNKSNRVKDRKSNKERSGKLYIKCKGYNNFFHNWT